MPCDVPAEFACAIETDRVAHYAIPTCLNAYQCPFFIPFLLSFFFYILTCIGPTLTHIDKKEQ